MALFINGTGQNSFAMNEVDIDNLYVDGVLVFTSAPPITDAPPIYLLTEDLVQPSIEVFVVNSSSSGEQYNGGLRTLNDALWSPDAAHYPKDGTIELGDTGGGEHKINTQWTMTADELLTFTFIDKVENNSYRMISLVPQGDGATANVLYDGVLDPVDTGLFYTPPLTPFEITSDMALTSVPIIPTCDITMSSYALGVGETATVTMTFNTVPVGLTIGEIVADNGIISSLSVGSEPWIYTATFTPDDGVSDDTNNISIGMAAFGDQWGNLSGQTFISPNYTVNTVAENLGAELALNSTFQSSDLSDYVTSGVVTWQEAGLVRVAVTTLTYAYIGQIFIETLEAGVTYRVRVKIPTLPTGAGNMEFYDEMTQTFIPFPAETDANGYYWYDAVGDGSYQDYIRVYMNGSTNGDYFEISEYSVREVL